MSGVPIASMAMAVMHEEMHCRTGQEQQVWQGPERVLPMVAQQPEQRGGGNRRRDHDRETPRRT